jgi:hypothetical protein
MSKHKDKIDAMRLASNTLNDQWSKNKITPEKDEESMKEKISQLIPKDRKRKFSLFR